MATQNSYFRSFCSVLILSFVFFAQGCMTSKVFPKKLEEAKVNVGEYKDIQVAKREGSQLCVLMELENGEKVEISADLEESRTRVVYGELVGAPEPDRKLWISRFAEAETIPVEEGTPPSTTDLSSAEAIPQKLSLRFSENSGLYKSLKVLDEQGRVWGIIMLPEHYTPKLKKISLYAQYPAYAALDVAFSPYYAAEYLIPKPKVSNTTGAFLGLAFVGLLF